MIPLFAVHMPHSVDKPLLDTLHSGYVGQGPRVDEFERKLGEWIGFKNILTTASGTVAIQLALRLAGVGQSNGGSSSDEVITTPMTCTATNMPILAAGAIPIFADVIADWGILDPNDVARKVTPNTKAIICVHWGGFPAMMDVYREISEGYGIPLIEDAAHAFGALLDDRKIGDRTADYTAFSFQAIKHITSVDGGALAVYSSSDYRRGKLIRWYGIDRETDRKDFRCEEDIEEWGLKWHMNDVNATIGITQLEYADGILKKHRNNAKTYWNLIDRERLIPAFPEEALDKSVFWLYTVLCNDDLDRRHFMNYMRQWGIQTSQVHARNDNHTVFKPYVRGKLPGLDRFSERMVCIPVHWKLEELEIEKIVDACKSFKVLDSVGI